MEMIAVIGPFNETMKRALEKAFPDTFRLEYITSREEYFRLSTADYIILRTLNYTAEDIAETPNIKLIQRWGVGFDTVDIGAAAEKGIPVAVTYGMNAIPVAEMTLALTLAVYRNLAPLTEGIQSGKWEREHYAATSYTISGKTVGIIGLGNVGRRAAALYKAFGATVLYYDEYRPSLDDELALGITYSDLDALWGKSDIISLHAPLTEKTDRLVNKETLAKMKKGAVLINTAREEMMDSQALAEALKSGELLGAGLDAIEEGLLAHNHFAGLKNVVLSGHLGGNTEDNAEHMARRCAEQIMEISSGGTLQPPHIVNAHLLNRGR